MTKLLSLVEHGTQEVAFYTFEVIKILFKAVHVLCGIEIV